MQRSSSENHEKNTRSAALKASTNSEFCPSCSEPFDNGKKRRLIDSCGHERCYTCMFSKELCSLCTFEGKLRFEFQDFLNVLFRIDVNCKVIAMFDKNCILHGSKKLYWLLHRSCM